MSKAKIKQLEAQLRALKNKTTATDLKTKCIKWVINKRGATMLKSESLKDYKRKDGETIKVKSLTFDNGETYNVGTHKFWKVK